MVGIRDFEDLNPDLLNIHASQDEINKKKSPNSLFIGLKTGRGEGEQRRKIVDEEGE